MDRNQDAGAKTHVVSMKVTFKWLGTVLEQLDGNEIYDAP